MTAPCHHVFVPIDDQWKDCAEESNSVEFDSHHRVQLLVSTMKLPDPIELCQKMRISGSAVIINQSQHQEPGLAEYFYDSNHIKVLTVRERGLSKSRNRALKLADAEFCIIADDDVRYARGYAGLVETAFQEYPDADIMAFMVLKENGIPIRTISRAARIGLRGAYQLSSVQLVMRASSIRRANVEFDETFGSGAENYVGEENIFLADCLRAGLRLYEYPGTLATLMPSTSSWFEGYTEKYFMTKGKVAFRMFPLLSVPFAIYFALSKRSRYKDRITTWGALRLMLLGILQQAKLRFLGVNPS